MTLDEVRELVNNITGDRLASVEIERTEYKERNTFRIVSEITSIEKIGGRVVVKMNDVSRFML